MKTVLAIGSPFGADRVGWQIAEQLQQLGVEQVHTCRHPIDLLPHFEESPDCIVIDALWANKKAGELIEVDPADLKKDYCRNAHGLNLFDVIQLAGISEQLPEHLRIYGVEINGRSVRTFTDSEVSDLVTQLCGRLNITPKSIA